MDRTERKWDKGKIKYHLVLPEFLELMAKILTEGEKNHPCEPDGRPSWQLVEPEAYEDALFRHLQAYRKGEIFDQDMKFGDEFCDHMGNIAVNAMFLWWFNRKKEYDNKVTMAMMFDKELEPERPKYIPPPKFGPREQMFKPSDFTLPLDVTIFDEDEEDDSDG